MKVVFLEDVVNVAKAGDTKDVADGYGRNYLLPKKLAVISQPDEGKGEMLVAVTNEPRLQLEEIRAVLRARGLTNLCAPRQLRVVREIPKLGTGKVNHRELENSLREVNPS